MEKRGVLKSWNDGKGFGFIQPEGGGEPLFVHISAMRGDSEQEFRDNCIETLVQTEALDFMIDTLKAIATETGRHAT